MVRATGPRKLGLSGLLGSDAGAFLQPVRRADDESFLAGEPRDDLDRLPEVAAQVDTEIVHGAVAAHGDDLRSGCPRDESIG